MKIVMIEPGVNVFSGTELQRKLSYERVYDLVVRQGHNCATIAKMMKTSYSAVRTLLISYGVPTDTDYHPWKTQRFFVQCMSWNLSAAEVDRLICGRAYARCKTYIPNYVKWFGLTFPPGSCRLPKYILSEDYLSSVLKYGFGMSDCMAVTHYSAKRITQYLTRYQLSDKIVGLLRNDRVELPFKPYNSGLISELLPEYK